MLKPLEKFFDFFTNNGEKIWIIISWCGFLPLSLFMIISPVIHQIQYYSQNIILVSIPAIGMFAGGIIALRLFWISRKGLKYYREHYEKE